MLRPGLMTNSLAGYSPLHGQAYVEPEFKTDFSEKFDKAKNKVVYMCSLSVIVSLFEIDETSSFFGLKWNNVSDTHIEWLVWGSALVITVNMLFRFFDERREFEKYKNEVNRFRSEFRSILDGLKSDGQELVDLLNDSNENIFSSSHLFYKRIDKFKDNIQKAEIDNKSKESILSDFSYMTMGVKQSVDRISERNREMFQQVSGIPNRISDFQKRNKAVRRFIGLGRIRFLIFDLFLPLSLFTIATTLQFSSVVQEALHKVLS